METGQSITIYLDNELIEDLDKLAKKENRTRSNLIETIIKQGMKRVVK
jgi:predicted transcriptional regulator